MNLEKQSAAPENTPRPFREIPPLWVRFWDMTEAFFRNELSHVSVPNTIYCVLTIAGASTIIYIAREFFRWIFNSFILPSTAQSLGNTTSLSITILSVSCVGIFLYPISFYMNNGITYIGALIFGGRGSFASQAYLNSLFLVPLGFLYSVTSIFSIIPVYGIYISYTGLFGFWIIQYVFTIRSFKVVHNFSIGRAIAAALSPLALLLIPICMIVILVAMGPMIGNVFSGINSSLLTPIP
jgi:hypothetical protein